MEGSDFRGGAVPFTNCESGNDKSSGNEISPVSIPLYYKMDRPKRGLALIFNHESFLDDYVPPRPGTNVDCDALGACLKQLGFKVTDYQNLQLKDIKRVLARVTDHTDNDCLVIAVLTHGGRGLLCAHNTPYRANVIWSYFTAGKCPSLKKKPKIFFIQACQGDGEDPGVTLQERTARDGFDEQDCRIRSYPDFLIAYSTVPGYYSWRNSAKGSWFIRALTAELSKNGKRCDLLTILTIVCQRVAVNFESYNSEDPSLSKKKQTPCITSMLTRLVRFSVATTADSALI